MKRLLLALLVLGCSKEPAIPMQHPWHPGDIGIDPEYEVHENPDFKYDAKNNGDESLYWYFPSAYRPVSVEIDPKTNDLAITWSAVESHHMKLPNNPIPKADPFLCLDDQCYRLVKSQKKLPD